MKVFITYISIKFKSLEMSCSYKDSETGKVCGVKTSINPKTEKPFDYCVGCFRQMRKNRQERFIDASRKAIGKRECQWVGNYIEGKTTFRIKCIELPIHDGWCSHHKKTAIEADQKSEKFGKSTMSKSNKGKIELDDELAQFVSKSGMKSRDKSKVLADNPELSEDDNIVVESNKRDSKKKVRETKQKPAEESSETSETKKVKEPKKSKKTRETKEIKDDIDEIIDYDDEIVVKKSTKKEKKSKTK